MIRRPSIHIFLDDLISIINDDKIIKSIIKKAKSNPVNRNVVISNQKININNNTELFNRILEAERYVAGHRSVKQIFKLDKSYSLLVDISKDADDFCRVFELNTNEGFIIYAKTGLKIIGRNYSINKFKTYKDKIFQNYERFYLMENSENIDLAISSCNYYLEKVGIEDESTLVNVWNNFGHDFVYLADQLVANNHDYITWIDSQFSALAYLKILPEPYQLHGEEAMKRYLLKSKKSSNNQTKDNTWRQKVKNGLHTKVE